MTCQCNCHAGFGPYKPTCNIDDGSSGVPGVPYCGYHGPESDTERSSLVAPCVYPGCDDGHDRACLTTLTICSADRQRYRRVIEWLVLDFVVLKTTMPAPVASGNAGPSRTVDRAYGHPRAWASDRAREIAQAMNDIEDDLREIVGDDPPPHPGVDESHLIAHSWKYFADHFDTLCTHPEAGDLAEHLIDLHRKTRSSMGYRRHFRTLPAPCPNCDLVGYLSIGEGEGTDRITCESCGEFIREDMFDFFVRTVAEDALDKLIDEYDTREAEVFAQKVNQ